MRRRSGRLAPAVLNNLTYGGARYIATGRGFATTRISFTILYSRFAGPSIYMAMRNLLLLLYASLAIWIPHLIYFWFSILSLCIAPFVFNPHQFSFPDFIIDYRYVCPFLFAWPHSHLIVVSSSGGCRAVTRGRRRAVGTDTAVSRVL